MTIYKKRYVKCGPFVYERINGVAYASLFGLKFLKKVGKVYQFFGVNWVKSYAS